MRYCGKPRFFKGIQRIYKRKNEKDDDNDFEKIECHVFFYGVIHSSVENKKDNRLEALVFSHL